MTTIRHTVRSACPSCGDVETRSAYDIGDGPELSCASCEWCWGANGQELHPMTFARVVDELGFDPLKAQRERAARDESG